MFCASSCSHGLESHNTALERERLINYQIPIAGTESFKSANLLHVIYFSRPSAQIFFSVGYSQLF
ncbi:unnamed protein product [Coffea canephora]|uniref:DH200=94 genomic scaffold, scaffold_1331 n=1 Tax=Coffea canephora TaxID=49390 RepID=A0A068VIX2_COFCA|nr:unnamed protein product [Coffea canephora]